MPLSSWLLIWIITAYKFFKCPRVFGKQCSEEIIIENAGILPLVPNALGIIFYLTIKNSGYSLLDTAVKMIECCESVNNDERDCSHMELSGGYMGRLKPLDKKNLTLMYHNMYPYNRRGDCVVAVWCRSDEGGFNELRARIDFDTMLSQTKVPPLLTGYYDPKEVTKCKSFDEDPLDKCRPVDCSRKYNGKRVYFSKRYNRCVPAPICTPSASKPLPDVAYVPEANVCADLEHPLGAADVKFFTQGIKCLESVDPNPGGFQVCHHGTLDRARGVCVCQPGWKSTPGNLRPTTLPVHMCTVPEHQDQQQQQEEEEQEEQKQEQEEQKQEQEEQKQEEQTEKQQKQQEEQQDEPLPIKEPEKKNASCQSRRRWWTDQPNCLPYVFEIVMGIIAVSVTINIICGICNLMTLHYSAKEKNNICPCNNDDNEDNADDEDDDDSDQEDPKVVCLKRDPCRKKHILTHQQKENLRRVLSGYDLVPWIYQKLPLSSSSSSRSISSSDETTDLTTSSECKMTDPPDGEESGSTAQSTTFQSSSSDEEDDESDSSCDSEDYAEARGGLNCRGPVQTCFSSEESPNSSCEKADNRTVKTVRFKVDPSNITFGQDKKTYRFSDVNILFASTSKAGQQKEVIPPAKRPPEIDQSMPREPVQPSPMEMPTEKETHVDPCDSESVAELTACSLFSLMSPLEVSESDWYDKEDGPITKKN